jgi:hypothetical protein
MGVPTAIETDDVKSIEIVDIEPALGEVAYFG